jgi:hypothetical protein
VAGLHINHIDVIKAKPFVLSDTGLTFKDRSPLSSDSERGDLLTVASES